MTTPSRLRLLDTNIVIPFVREGSIGQAIDARFQLRARPDRPLLSVISVGEALAFARRRGWGAPSVDALAAVLRELVVVDITSRAVLDRYAEIDTFLKRNGRTVGDNDTWIAACASAAEATLLTTDRDFDPLHGSYLERVWIDPRNPGEGPAS
jgi:tRNA(fMet)-specific endonuclease VapC